MKILKYGVSINVSPNRKLTYDGPKKGRHRTIYPDNISNQIPTYTRNLESEN